jgi:hypothetical protein
MAGCQSLSDFGTIININPKMMGTNGEKMRATFLAQNTEANVMGERNHWAPTTLTPIQAVIVHEWAHVVEFNLWARAPKQHAAIQAEWVGQNITGGKAWLNNYNTGTGDGTRMSQANTNAAVLGGGRLDTSLITRPFGSAMSQIVGTSSFRGEVRSRISKYGAEKAAETWAELFLMSYGNPGRGAKAKWTPERKKAADSFTKIIDKYWPEIEGLL